MVKLNQTHCPNGKALPDNMHALAELQGMRQSVIRSNKAASLRIAPSVVPASLNGTLPPP
jgi:hypothetical protein